MARHPVERGDPGLRLAAAAGDSRPSRRHPTPANRRTRGRNCADQARPAPLLRAFGRERGRRSHHRPAGAQPAQRSGVDQIWVGRDSPRACGGAVGGLCDLGAAGGAAAAASAAARSPHPARKSRHPQIRRQPRRGLRSHRGSRRPAGRSVGHRAQCRAGGHRQCFGRGRHPRDRPRDRRAYRGGKTRAPQAHHSPTQRL